MSLVIAAPSAHADWHAGTVTTLGFGYDGTTVIFKISSLNKTGCTCYSPWPDSLCLDRNRTSFREEYALLLKNRATKQPVAVNIDETTCTLVAIYETD
jgi:hypothetical protein